MYPELEDSQALFFGQEVLFVPANHQVQLLRPGRHIVLFCIGHPLFF